MLPSLQRALNEIVILYRQVSTEEQFKDPLSLFPHRIYNNAGALKLMSGSRCNFSSLSCLSFVHISSFMEMTDFMPYLIILWLLPMVPPFPSESLSY